MQKIRKITYPLRVNGAQRAWLKEEVRKSEVMYRYFQKLLRQRRKSGKQMEEKTLHELMLSYQRKYMRGMRGREVAAMRRKLLQEAEEEMKRPFFCEEAAEQFCWRGISLYPMIEAAHSWQQLPLLQHWPVLYSALFFRGSKGFLIVWFEEQQALCRHRRHVSKKKDRKQGYKAIR